jgi:DNA-binding MarR family transcriptional regulator
MTGVHAAVLEAADTHPKASGRALARAIGETAQTTHDALAALTWVGYLERAASPTNARIRETKLTAAGRTALAAVRRAGRAADRRARARITPDEAQHLVGILHRLAASLTEADGSDAADGTALEKIAPKHRRRKAEPRP